MKKAEVVIIILSIIAIGLDLILVPYADIFAILILTIISFLYFYLSFALFNDIRLRSVFKRESYKGINNRRIIGAIGVGLALSVTIIGIVFKFQSFPGADFNLGLGLVGLLIVALIGLFRYLKNKSEFYTRIIKRVVIFGGIGLILLLTPQTTWIEFKYRNHPDYVEALKKAIADPDNEMLWEEVKNEKQKMKK